MNRAQQQGVELRRELGLRGRVDVEAFANALGLEVWPWDFEVQQELQVDGHVAVARRLSPEWQRWVIAHAIGHRLLHPGNHLELRAHTATRLAAALCGLIAAPRRLRFGQQAGKAQGSS